MVYIMVAQKSNVVPVEDDALNLSPIRQNSNSYPSKDNTFVDYFSTFIPYGCHLWDTVIPENIDLSSNKIPEIRSSVLSSIHITGTKYRIYSSKSETATIITIHKMNEIIESNTTLEVTHDKGVTCFLMNFKFIVMMLESRFLFQNIPHSTSSVFSKSIVKYSQYNSGAVTDY